MIDEMGERIHTHTECTQPKLPSRNDQRGTDGHFFCVSQK